jgi:hypothetical protein
MKTTAKMAILTHGVDDLRTVAGRVDARILECEVQCLLRELSHRVAVKPGLVKEFFVHLKCR